MMSGGGLCVIGDLYLLLGREGVSGRAVHIRHASARTCVTVDECLVALVLYELADGVEHRGGEDLVDSAVCHRGILIELRALFDAALNAAGNSEDEADTALRLGEEKLRIHLVGRTAKAAHRRDTAGVSTCCKSDLLDFLTCKHYISSSLTMDFLHISLQ